MTVAIPEARAVARPRTVQGQVISRREAPRQRARQPRQPRAQTFRGQRPIPPPAPPRQRSQRPQRPQRPRVKVSVPGPSGSLSDYQPVILAEFVAALLLVALSPIAARKTARAPQGQVGLSPYAAADMVQLGAITLTYLILALISTGPRGAGRASAWFGGLILLALGLVKTGTIAKILDLFGAGGPPPAGVEAGGGPILGIAPTPTGQQPQPPIGIQP